MEFENREYYVKNKEIICPNCGTRTTIDQLLKDGEFDEMCFEESCEPQEFNPFDNPNRKGHGSDRLTLPFNCHCSGCGWIITVNLALSIFGYDIYDNDCNIIDTAYTEKIE